MFGARKKPEMGVAPHLEPFFFDSEWTGLYITKPALFDPLYAPKDRQYEFYS